MKGREVTFQIDKRREPVLLSEEDTLVNTIIRALFLKPGQNPVNPDAGVDIRKYIYKTTDEIDSSQIRADLILTCGSQLINTSIQNLAIASELVDGIRSMIIQIDIKIDDKAKILAIGMQQLANNRIHLNYKFMDKIVK